MAIIRKIINIFRFHKFKIFCLLILTLVFVVLLFPYNDLGDIAASKISKASGGAFYLSMENFDLNFFPLPKVVMGKVVIEPKNLPPLSIQKLTLYPSVTSFLTFSPGGSVQAQGIFQGNINLDVSQGSSGKTKLQVVEIQVENIALSVINELLRSPTQDFSLKGKLQGLISARVDPTFSLPPSGSFSINLNSFSANLTSMIGAEINFAKAQFTGKMADGKILIEQAQLGDSKDELNGKIKGKMDLAIVDVGGVVRLMPGAYDFMVDLNVSDNMNRKLGLILDSVTASGGKAEKNSGGGTLYRFRALPGSGGIPRFAAPEF